MIYEIKHVKMFLSIINILFSLDLYCTEELKSQLFCFSASSNQMHFMAIDKEIPMRQELKGPTSKSIVYNLKMLSQSMWLQRHMTSITSSLINRWWQDTIEWVFVELALDI